MELYLVSEGCNCILFIRLNDFVIIVWQNKKNRSLGSCDKFINQIIFDCLVLTEKGDL